MRRQSSHSVLETIGTIGTSVTVGTGFGFEILMEHLHRYTGLKQRMIATGFKGSGLVSRDRRDDPRKIETAPKIRKWFQNLHRLST